MRFLSDIFLRLIQCVVAPLIFAMLVVGIASHGDLKSVGRMGIKSIVYFEVVTTVALFIGLLAINISKAGVGLAFTPGTIARQAATSAHALERLPHPHLPGELRKERRRRSDPAGRRLLHSLRALRSRLCRSPAAHPCCAFAKVSPR